MAPEVIEKRPYGKATDLWSLGAVTYDMLVGQPPFLVSSSAAVTCKDLRGGGHHKKGHCSDNSKSGTNRPATKYNILHCNYKIPDFVSSRSGSFINALLQLDVEHRLGGYDADFNLVRGHDYFREIEWVKVSNGKLIPPFIPRLQSSSDVSNFDEKHTEDSKDSGAIIEALASKKTETRTEQGQVRDTNYHIEHFDYTLPSLAVPKLNQATNQGAQDKCDSS